MSIGTYSQLQAVIADTLNRQDLTAVIPTFIRLAEARIDRELRHWKQTQRATLTLSGQYNAVLPADFLQFVRLQLTDGPTRELAPVSNAAMLDLRADRNDRPGRPENYALTAGELEIYPTPDGTYTASAVYYSKIPSLSDTNTTNWLLTDAPDVYLYGAMLHSAPYLKDDARAALWEGLYKLAIDTLSLASEDARWGGSGLRMKTRQ